MQVRSGRVSGGTDRADDLACPNLLALGHVDRGLVAVPELRAVPDGDDGPVAVGAGRTHLADPATRYGANRRPARSGEVEAGVTVRPQPGALAEARGEVVGSRGDRQSPGVPGDLGRLLSGVGCDLGQGGLPPLGLPFRHCLQPLVGRVLQRVPLGVATDRAGPTRQQASRPVAFGPGQHTRLGRDLAELTRGDAGCSLRGAHCDRSDGGDGDRNGAGQRGRGNNAGKGCFASAGLGNRRVFRLALAAPFASVGHGTALQDAALECTVVGHGGRGSFDWGHATPNRNGLVTIASHRAKPIAVTWFTTPPALPPESGLRQGPACVGTHQVRRLGSVSWWLQFGSWWPSPGSTVTTGAPR